MKLVLPVIFLLVGAGAGIGARIVMGTDAKAHDPDGPAADSGDEHPEDAAIAHATDVEHSSPSGEAEIGTDEYVKLNNQFVVSVVEEGEITALVVLSLSLQVGAGETALTYQHEPKVRDALLTVLFDHANAGGFSGDYIGADRMLILRDALLEASRRVLGSSVRNVLIQDLVRQDL